MAIQAALFFETVEQIYARIFSALKPRDPLPEITVKYRKYANANSRIRLAEGVLEVTMSDMLEHAPAPVQEALAQILLSKLFRRSLDPDVIAQYRLYLNRSDIRGALHRIKKERGRKTFLGPAGRTYNLETIFDELDREYFNSSVPKPKLGWSVKPSRTALGHYDPAHHTIVVSRFLDRPEVPRLVVKYVMFHEMLHIMHPTKHNGARRCVHTPEFKRAERTFRDFELARKEVKRLADLGCR
jgi:hypothetical protein